MKKITFDEMYKVFSDHNKKLYDENNFWDGKIINGYIVYKSSNWPDKDYSLESRTYGVCSQEKYFCWWMGGSSLYGSSLDNTDQCVRLDWVDWDIDYCYIEEDEQD